MPAGAPDGVMPPTLTAVNSTAITAVWGPPGRVNGPVGVVYQLQYRSANVPLQNVFSQSTGKLLHALLLLMQLTEKIIATSRRFCP